MAPTPPPVRVIVRLPYNRPEDPLQDPPRVEWSQEKEHILWEVIAKSRAIEGAGTDWKGLATHLQVPLPYLLHRAQTRYEEDLRGLQGISGVLSPTSAAPNSAGFPVLSPVSPQQPNGNEYFPRLPEVASHRLSTSSATATRPLGVRARLSSLGQQSPRIRRTSTTRNASQRSATNMGGSVTASTLTLQGPRRSKTAQRVIPFTSSHVLTESAFGDQAGYSTESEESDEDEDTRKEEEEDRRAEEERVLETKLLDLQKMITKDALGLVSSPKKAKGKIEIQDRGRTRPLSMSTASLSSNRPSSSRSQQSLSSLSSRSPPGSIPSIPSPPPHTPQHMHWRSHPDTRINQSYGYYASQSPPASSPRMASPIPRHLSPSGKSSSPPVISPGRALGQTHTRGLESTSGGKAGRRSRHTDDGIGTTVGGRVSEHGSTTSSFSDIEISGSGEDLQICLYNFS
ncbi:uncharacterized protein FIBRA_00249 [Fibroporia radiculosa]|uniref:Autophagy-related protein 29 n=1 Tax=Fibroporia radiculosa TaxID=599839 RepID=J7RV87_9APHY|nr:uncharacterized protein FIBRA_00249 [Fibroporia radiculosa]CCL98255.1 predicted protein [Fibroporia radiculosa]